MSEPAHGISPEQTEQDTPKKKRGIVFLLRIIAVIAALLAVAGLAIPQLRKSSALGAVGERVLAEMTPFSVAVSYYSGEDLSRLSQKQNPTDAGYRKMAQLFEQIRILQGYDRLYLLCRDGERQLFYLGDGQPFPIGSYKPLKTILDRIYTGKSTGAYAKDLITREDGKKAAASCIPLYGNGRTVLAVLVVEADPGNTNYHLVGPINLHLVGLVSGALLLVCLLLLWLIRKRRLAQAQCPEAAAPSEEPSDPLSPCGQPQTSPYEPESDAIPSAPEPVSGSGPASQHPQSAPVSPQDPPQADPPDTPL